MVILRLFSLASHSSLASLSPKKQLTLKDPSLRDASFASEVYDMKRFHWECSQRETRGGGEQAVGGAGQGRINSLLERHKSNATRRDVLQLFPQIEVVPGVPASQIKPYGRQGGRQKGIYLERIVIKRIYILMTQSFPYEEEGWFHGAFARKG